ncbi:unnamed protein product [Diamesa serratosioi]
MTNIKNKELDNFRKGWLQELNTNSSNVVLSPEVEKEATEYFRQGIALEQQGKVFEALPFYRKAVNLVPDIEYRTYEANQQQNEDLSTIKSDTLGKSNNLKENKNDNKDIHSILEDFEKSIALTSNHICYSSNTAGTISTGGIHISSLPLEVMLLILKWVVSNQLDFRSLESFAGVCKGFFLISRDTDIWKTACKKVWGNVLLNEEFSSWRNMYINKPRVNYNGCYISKITYQRYGENSFQDQYYRPVQMVEYFRIIRFLPNGKLLMFTSADNIQKSINKIKNFSSAFEMPEILSGSYKFEDNFITIIIKKHRSKKINKRKPEQHSEKDLLSFFIKLQIGSTRKMNFNKLLWLEYSLTTQQHGQELSTSEFDLSSSSKFTPFYFSVVKSFHEDTRESLSV